MKKTLLLCILDGYGISSTEKGNAIASAKKENIDYLFANYPSTILQACGENVGLPEGQMGNSEVGHLNIGAGRIVYQALTLIDKAIKDGSFYQNEAYLETIRKVKERDSSLHIMGLVSDGGVHSHINHIKAIVELAAKEGVKKIFVHAFLDGRDVFPTSASTFFDTLLPHLQKYGATLATISGRYYAMDRDKNLDRVDRALSNICLHTGNKITDVKLYLNSQYQKMEKEGKSVSDEFVEPGYTEGANFLASNDGVIHINFRPDRAIILSTLITNPHFYQGFKPSVLLENIAFTSTMVYASSVIGNIAFEIKKLKNILGVYLADNGLSQLRIAETEKYAHVTFFFDGGVNYDGVSEKEIEGCDRILIPSPKVATYDLLPEMSIYEVCQKVVENIGRYDVIICNLANCDMVGHTAVFDAIVEAVEHVDKVVGQFYQKVKEVGGVMVLTADHGNADCVIDFENRLVTSHTLNPVPFLISNKNLVLTQGGRLADIAPTILDLLGLTIPPEMVEGEGRSLLDNCQRRK